MKKYLLFIALSPIALFANDTNIDPIQKITSGYEYSLDERVNTIHQLPPSLTKEQFDTLISYLYKTTDSAINDEIHFCTLKNDILAKLCTQRLYNEKLTHTLIEMYNTPQLGECWHNYTLQYLSSLHTHTTLDNKIRIIDFYKKTLKNTKNTGLGTILIALKNIAQESKNQKLAKETANIAHTIYKTQHLSDIDTLAAFQVMTALNHPETQNIAHTILKKSESTNLKVCAIYALKQINDPSDQPLLNLLGNSPDPRIRSAIK